MSSTYTDKIEDCKLNHDSEGQPKNLVNKNSQQTNITSKLDVRSRSLSQGDSFFSFTLEGNKHRKTQMIIKEKSQENHYLP